MHNFQALWIFLLAFRQSSKPPPHPVRLHTATEAAKLRWAQDGYATQVHQYADQNLIWERGIGRLPSLSERSRIQGIDPSYILPCLHHDNISQAACRDALGNAITVGILQRLLQPFQHGFRLRSNPWAVLRLQHPRRADFLDFLRPAAFQLAIEFADLAMEFNNYFSSLDGSFSSSVIGPDMGSPPQHAKHSMLGDQRASYFSKKGAPALLPSDLSPDEHLRQSACLVHPFFQPTALSSDLQFAATTVSEHQEHIIPFRFNKLRRLTAFAHCCLPHNHRIKSLMPPIVKEAAANLNIFLLLVLVISLRWPDWAFPDRFLYGIKTVASVDSLNLYLPITPKGELDIDDVMVQENDDWNYAQANCSPNELDDTIREATEKDRRKGQVQMYLTKAEADHMFGRGKRRGIPRRTIWQRNAGKFRNVDNCKRSLHNHLTVLIQTIFTVPSDQAEHILFFYRSLFGQPLIDLLSLFLVPMTSMTLT